MEHVAPLYDALQERPVHPGVLRCGDTSLAFRNKAHVCVALGETPAWAGSDAGNAAQPLMAMHHRTGGRLTLEAERKKPRPRHSHCDSSWPGDAGHYPVSVNDVSHFTERRW